MQLYELPRNSLFTFVDTVVRVPVGAAPFTGDDAVYRFVRLDGTFSICEDSQGNVFHPAAWTNVEIHNG